MTGDNGGPNSLNTMLTVNNLGCSVFDGYEQFTIFNTQAIFFIDPIQNDAVGIIATFQSEIFDAINSARI